MDHDSRHRFEADSVWIQIDFLDEFMITRNRIRTLQASAFLLAVPVALWAFGNGPPAGYTTAPEDHPGIACTNCHKEFPLNSQGGSVSIAFPNGLNYTPGKAQTLTVTITDAAAVAYGFEMSARVESSLAGGQAGSFTAGVNQKIICAGNVVMPAAGCADNGIQWIEQSQPLTTNTFSVQWTPPTTNAGNLHFYIAANAAIDGPPSFGHIYAADYVLVPPAPPLPVLTGSMAQLASGGGWDTALTLINTSGTAGQAVLDFFGNDSSPLGLPLTFPQTPSPSCANGSTVTCTVNGHSLLVIDIQQPDNPNAQVGSAQLLANDSIGGFAIFSYLPTGQEAVVPLETRNAASYVLAFDNTGALATGVAIANIKPQTANIPVVIRDDTGAQIGTGTVMLAAQGHTSFMLTDNYGVTVGKRGTLQLDTPPSGQVSVLGLRANGSALTTIPVLANVTAGGGSMAQVASGGGWQTTFTLVNTGTAPANAQLNFFDNNGNPLSLPFTFLQSGKAITSASVSQTIAAGATLVVLTQGSNAGASVVGSAQLITAGDVSGFAIFRYNPTGQEAVVPLSAGNANKYVLAFDNTSGLATGVALANVSNQAVSVPVVLRDDTGATLGNTAVKLAANGHTSFVLTDNYASVAGKRGTVDFDTPTGAQISVLGIRATPAGAVTTIPVLAK